jgi:hypothetical protein
MATFTRAEQRINRKHVLDALNSETGSNGGSIAEARVKAYRQNPQGASTTEFGYVGGIVLRRFYVAPGKPNTVERRSLWQNITTRMNKLGTKDPGGWDGETDVMTLQQVAEEA